MLPTGEHKPAMMSAIRELVDFIGDRQLDQKLGEALNDTFGQGTAKYSNLVMLLRHGIEEGWACYTEILGPDYRRGRIADPSTETRGFSIESSMIKDRVGNYHVHTRGEINMVAPIDETGQFCGQGAGWSVFAPGSEHYPTVTGGKVTTLFLLPNGEIEYRAPRS
jgi:Domain of unknown function (DUF4863)